ncbi:MAG: gfo/Idh/MocA family oxidoreductase [Candidatus Electrothrix sp. AS4_5]|nr:gfo/Idh/MocA family oxidoreductase [Candidatus Electrothrix gigas]
MKKIRFGVIGCANIAMKSFIPALKKSKTAELTAVASRSLEKAEKFANKFHCIPVCGYENLLKRNDIDAVYIATPTGLHAHWVIASAQSGKHILCEKTLAKNVKETLQILAACEKNDVALLEGFSYQFHPQHKELSEIVRQGKIGEPVLLQACFGFPPIKSEHRYNPEFGGGALLDAGTYTAHIARNFFKRKPQQVYSVLNYKEKKVDIHGSVLLNFGNGQTASLTFGFDNMYQNFYSIWGTKGLVKLNRSFSISSFFSPTIILERQDYREERVLQPYDQFLGEIESFCTHLHNSEKKTLWRQDALDQSLVIEKIKENSTHNEN